MQYQRPGRWQLRSAYAFLFFSGAVFAISFGTPGACGMQQPHPMETDDFFEVGGENDPVRLMAQALKGTTRSHALIRINNTSGTPFESGLLTTQPLFEVDQQAVAVLIAYLGLPDANPSTARTLATDLGLELGVDAFVVPPADAGSSRTVSVRGLDGPLYYTALRADENGNSLVAAFDIPIEPGTAQSQGRGNDAKGSAIVSEVAHYQIDAQGFVRTGAPAGSISYADLTNCQEVMSEPVVLLDNDFSAHTNESEWPYPPNGDFGGDWITTPDGKSMFYNPNWGGASPDAPMPTMTGWVLFADVCPQEGSTITLGVDFTSDVTSEESALNLHLYFFDANMNVLGAVGSTPLGQGISMRGYLHDIPVPAGTRTIAAVSMSYFAIDEQGTGYFENLLVEYRPANFGDSRTLIETNFDDCADSEEWGTNQPRVGESFFGEYGDDYYCAGGGMTVRNPSWYEDPATVLPVDTGAVNSFELGAHDGNSRISCDTFAAVEFTDENSFFEVQLLFDTADLVTSPWLAGNNYGTIRIHEAPIPQGAISARVVLRTYLGETETSSVLVTHLHCNIATSELF